MQMSGKRELSSSQHLAIEHITQYARTRKCEAQKSIKEVLQMSNIPWNYTYGSVSAYPGGARDLWEKKMFGGAYQLDGVTNSQRPKYGALNLLLHPDGPAPRFGSCYFLLSSKVS
jgi:hypothetical protein